MKHALTSLRNHFVIGFVAILPLAFSVWLFLKLFNIVMSFSDNLLRIIPGHLHELVFHINTVTGEEMPSFPFRILAFLISIACVTLLGFVAKNVIGQSFLGAMESLALRVPLLNKIYGGAKQILDAFGASKAGVFQRVVLVRFPYRESYSIGFVTAEAKGEVQEKTDEEVINIFVPTTPNPTSGFLLLVPKRETIPLDMSVADAIKMVISGGAVTPPHPSTPTPAAVPNGNP
ncbi:MAG: DUF502 domain-containing protein [Verrucomicrobiae bacterium]|nr:DUF502 domain-containing protein [Verrucomicrobiae bacterium]